MAEASNNEIADRLEAFAALLELAEANPYTARAYRRAVRIVCSTDAHRVRGLQNMAFSVATARRGWATAADVLNTLPLSGILAGRRAR